MEILLIEDDPAIFANVRAIFQFGWPEAIVTCARLGKEGLQRIECKAPDLVILDLGLPDISGLDVLKQIRVFSSIPVIILTVRNEESDIVQGFALGADDYIAKPFKQLELLARSRALLRRTVSKSDDTSITAGNLRFGDSIRELYKGSRMINLTITEGSIMHLLMENANHVIYYSKIAEAVWGHDYPDSTDSLKVYIRHIRKKIEVDPSNPNLIINKPGIGYVLYPENSE